MTPLACLFPGDEARFFARYPEAPFAADGELSRFPAFLQELSLEWLCERYRGELDLHAADSRPVTVRADGLDATLWLLQRSAGVTFDRIERFVPGLQDWCTQLADELQLPGHVERPRCNAFASPRSSGYQFHFHYEGALLVQLEGLKDVRLAPVPGGTPVVQTDANQPFEDGFGSEPRPMSAHAQFAATGFPAPPEQTELYELSPGSVLYIPPGYWHATRSRSDRSFAFSLFLSPPRWYEVFLRALELVLLTDPDWRRPAGPASQLPELAARFARAASTLRAEDLQLCLGQSPALSAASTLCPNPDARWSLQDGRLQIRTDHDYDIEIEPELEPALRALLEHRAPFPRGDAPEEAVQLLLSVGALVRGPFPTPS
jgi:hypothetical protein